MKKHLLLTFSLFFGLLLNAQTVILDFESPETSTNYQYFGSTLDGSVNNIIANPDASGINTSPTVADFVKPAASEVWAGAFPNPALPAGSGDMATYGEICVDVWMPVAGSVSLKFEASSNGGANWVTTQDVSTAQTWTQVCYDPTENSIEDPFTPASGFVYDVIVLFFDFGESLTEERTYYFDNMILQGTGPGAGDPVNVTFQVDMNSYADAFTTAYLSGTMNGWAGDANPMVDDDGDGVWETTVAIAPGPYEYKFQLDQWAVDEQFGGGEACTITDASGEFVNRYIEVAGESTVCFEWNTCTSCLASGVRDLAIDHSLFSISPNPASSLTNLNFSENLMVEKTVRLYNTTGSLLSEAKLGTGVSQHQLNLNDLAPGLYMVVVQTADQLATQKLVRE